MIIRHWTEVLWDEKRWPNFSPGEPFLACPCCGEFYYDPISMDKLQKVRYLTGVPLNLNSAHRCPIHNTKVKGALRSQHKKIAFDISLRNQYPGKLLSACIKAGFNAFGFYGSFLHVDNRPGRRAVWISKKGKNTWTGLIYLVR